MDKVHLEKKGDIAIKKIDATNVARKGTLLEIVNSLWWKVMWSLSIIMVVKRNRTSKHLLQYKKLIKQLV